MKQILLIDNYDSFTFNLEHYLTALGASVEVRRNDEIIEDLENFDAVVFSPGPGLPDEAGNMMSLLDETLGKVPVLGICLGMQAISIYFGGVLYNQNRVKHGVKEEIELGNSILFTGMTERINVGLYHSWAVDSAKNILDVSAFSKDGTIMAIENHDKRIYGVQFHPESILTDNGMTIIENFLNVI